MEGAKEFLIQLRVKYNILISLQLEEYLITLYQTCANLEEIDIEDYIYFCFERSEIDIITKELQKVIKAAKLQKIKNELIKIIEQRDDQDKYKRKASFVSDVSEKTQIQEITQSSPIKQQEDKENEADNKLKEEVDDSNEGITQPRPTKLKKIESLKPAVKSKGLKKQLQEKKTTKCRSYPFCGKANCEYFHPNEKCAYFPKCKQGQNCLYMHDICKYGSLCCRVGCFYEHNPKIKGIQPFNLLIKVKSMHSTSVLIKEIKTNK